jgi:hypothetical protein
MALLAAAAVWASTSASADLVVDWESTSSPFIGTITPGTPADPVNELDYLTKLLALDPGKKQTYAIEGVKISPFVHQVEQTYTRSAAEIASGDAIVTSVGYFKDESGGKSIPAGYDFVLAKYGLTSAVWYLGGEPNLLPANVDGKGLSHFIAFNAVPEPTTLIAGALLLLPFGASTIRMLRNRHNS